MLAQCGCERHRHNRKIWIGGNSSYLASFGQGCMLVEGNRLSSELMSNRKISGAIAGELLDSGEPDSSGDEGAD